MQTCTPLRGGLPGTSTAKELTTAFFRPMKSDGARCEAVEWPYGKEIRFLRRVPGNLNGLAPTLRSVLDRLLRGLAVRRRAGKGLVAEAAVPRCRHSAQAPRPLRRPASR